MELVLEGRGVVALFVFEAFFFGATLAPRFLPSITWLRISFRSSALGFSVLFWRLARSYSDGTIQWWGTESD